MADLTIEFDTPLGDTQTLQLADLLKALPRNKTLMLRYSASDAKVVANFGGDVVASDADTATAISKAYAAFLLTVRIENPNRKKEPSYVQPDLRRKPLAGNTIPWGSLPSHVKKKVST
jgi:hypothetical protein